MAGREAKLAASYVALGVTASYALAVFLDTANEPAGARDAFGFTTF